MRTHPTTVKQWRSTSSVQGSWGQVLMEWGHYQVRISTIQKLQILALKKLLRSVQQYQAYRIRFTVPTAAVADCRQYCSSSGMRTAALL
jgi:hypothetical protein